MTLTPAFCTGFEHGVSPAANNGGGLGGGLAGAPAVRNTNPRTGTYACRFNPAGAAMDLQMPPGPATAFNAASMRFYLRFTTKPSANSLLASMITTAGASMNFGYTSSSDRFSVFIGAGTRIDVTDLGAPSTGVYYLIEMWCDVSTTTADVRVRVNGGTVYQQTGAITASTVSRFQMGTTSTHTYDMDVDDWIGGSATVTPEFWGPGHVTGLLPNADGTHNAGTNTVEDNAGADIGAVAAWSIVDDLPLSEATTFIKQSAIGTGNYAEVAFADLSGGSRINAVEALLSYGSSSATNTNSGETRIRRGDGTPTDVLGLGANGVGLTSTQKTTIGTAWDMSDTGPLYKASLVPLTANGSDYNGWSQSLVNSLLARVGFAGDVTPVPEWFNLMLEVDVAEDLGFPFPRNLQSHLIGR